jgi:hypothetical protein
MSLEVVEVVTSAGGPVNDDRAGASGSLAWVIDGATDLVAPTLTGEVSDAAWFAARMDELLRNGREIAETPLAELPAYLAERLSAAFAQARRRKPAGREEYPSAAGIIVRAHATQLEYVSLGDCSLLAEQEGGICHVGVDEEEAGDRWAVEEIASYLSRDSGATIVAARQDLWTKFAAVRARMNIDGGYGIFTITPPPTHLVRAGTIAVEPGAYVLLATDGLLRLVDVFRRYDHKRLLEAARIRGLAFLLDELRAIESADPDCAEYPRTKVSDDATGVLLRVG